MTSPTEPVDPTEPDSAEDTSVEEKKEYKRLEEVTVPIVEQRIAKLMARAGLCSRRDAEKLIDEGRVVVNGEVIRSPALNVGAEDSVVVDGKPLPKLEPPRLWRYHKPAGLVTTSRDEQGRATVFDNLPKDMPRVISVGRLDLNSEGLLLLTNDGELARKMELPENGLRRTYRVRIRGVIDEKKFALLKEGIVVDRIHYGSIDVKVDRQQGSNAWLEVTLTEGKNREIRRVMEHIGYDVNRLIRIRYGYFFLGQLPRNNVDEVSPADVRKLLGKPAHKGAKAKPRKTRPNSKAYKLAKKSGFKKPDAKAASPRSAADKRTSGTLIESNRTAGKKPFIQKKTDGKGPAGKKSFGKKPAGKRSR